MSAQISDYVSRSKVNVTKRFSVQDPRRCITGQKEVVDLFDDISAHPEWIRYMRGCSARGIAGRHLCK
jgi:hypothetical protein